MAYSEDGRNVTLIAKDVTFSEMITGYELSEFIVSEIFPIVSVKHQSDNYYIWEKADFFKIPDTKRAPKPTGNAIEFNVSSEGYYCNNYELWAKISYESIVNADSVLNLRHKYAKSLKNLLTLDWEIRVASMITSGSNLGSYTTLSGTDQWNDDANSDPLGDVETGKNAIRSSTGLNANLMIIGYSVFRELVNHPDMVDRISHTQKGVVTADVLSQVFDIERVLIGKSIKGEPDNLSDVWGKNVVIMHVSKHPESGGRDPSCGYSFRWKSPLLEDFNRGVWIWKDPDGRGFENIRVQMYQDEKLTAPELGYLIEDAIY